MFKKKRKGWYRKAKIKFINREVHSYEICKHSLCKVSERSEDKHITSQWVGARKQEFQEDILKIKGFAERFLWTQELQRKYPDRFYFEYVLKKDFEY